MKELVNKYIENVAGAKERFSVHENFWNEYNKAKEQKLFKLFDGQLIIEQPIKIEKSLPEMIADIRDSNVRFDIFSSVDLEIRSIARRYTLTNEEKDKVAIVSQADTCENKDKITNAFECISSPSRIAKTVFQKDFDFIHPTTGKTVKLQKGSKISKALKHFISDKEKLTKVQNKISVCLNDKHIEGQLCLSIHPMDYLTASVNMSGWSSCYDTLNQGCWCASTLCLINSPNTFMVYLKSKKDATYAGVEWNNKRWRTFATLSESNDAVHFGRNYPYHNEKLELLAKDMVEQLTGFCYENHNVEGNVVAIETSGNMYNDCHDGSISTYYTEELGNAIDDGKETETIVISEYATCPCCGQEYSDCETQIVCFDCGNCQTCECCGDYMSHDDVYYVEGYGDVCDYCISNRDFYHCEDCDTYHVSERIVTVHYTSYNGTGFEKMVCEDCLNHGSYSYCEDCGEYYETSLMDGDRCDECAADAREAEENKEV